MPSQSPSCRPAIFAHGIAGATLLFAFGEQILGGVITGSAYLSSNLFYLPEVILGGLVALAVQLAICPVLLLTPRFRPNFNIDAASPVSGFLVVAYLLVAAYPETWVAMISSVYGNGTQGPILIFFCVGLTAFLIPATFLAIVWRNRPGTTSGLWKKRAAYAASVVIGVIVAILYARPLYESYAALNLVLVWALGVPMILSLGLYRLLAGRTGNQLLLVSRIGFFLGVLIALVSLGGQYWGDPGGGMLLASIVIATFTAYGAMTFRGARTGAILGPALPALLLFLIPVLEITWRARTQGDVEPGQHIILITIDTLRRDTLSAYNPEAIPTANIDTLLRDGALFTRAWSPASWTLPSLVSIHTGVEPLVHRTGDIRDGLSSVWETLAEKFSDRGYTTEAIVYNPLLTPDRGLAQGFDRYWFFPEFKKPTNIGQRLARKIWLDRYEPSGSVSSMTELAKLRILRNREKPYFLWLHHFDPHPPYLPPARHWPEGIPRDQRLTPPGERSWIEKPELQAGAWAGYIGEVQYVDECVGKFRRDLQNAGLYEDMTVIFTSDHGEEFWEKERWGHGNPPTDTQVRMPLMIKSPGVPSGLTIDRMTSTYEIGSVLMGLLEARLWEGQTDISALETVLAEIVPPPGKPEGFFTTSHHQTRIRTDGIIFGDAPYKYLFDRINEREELYNLADDPDELRSLVTEAPEMLERGRALYAEHQAYGEAHGISEDEAQMELSPEIEAQLRAHGYMK